MKDELDKVLDEMQGNAHSKRANRDAITDIRRDIRSNKGTLTELKSNLPSKQKLIKDIASIKGDIRENISSFIKDMREEFGSKKTAHLKWKSNYGSELSKISKKSYLSDQKNVIKNNILSSNQGFLNEAKDEFDFKNKLFGEANEKKLKNINSLIKKQDNKLKRFDNNVLKKANLKEEKFKEDYQKKRELFLENKKKLENRLDEISGIKESYKKGDLDIFGDMDIKKITKDEKLVKAELSEVKKSITLLAQNEKDDFSKKAISKRKNAFLTESKEEILNKNFKGGKYSDFIKDVYKEKAKLGGRIKKTNSAYKGNLTKNSNSFSEKQSFVEQQIIDAQNDFELKTVEKQKRIAERIVAVDKILKKYSNLEDSKKTEFVKSQQQKFVQEKNSLEKAFNDNITNYVAKKSLLEGANKQLDSDAIGLEKENRKLTDDNIALGKESYRIKDQIKEDKRLKREEEKELNKEESVRRKRRGVLNRKDTLMKSGFARFVNSGLDIGEGFSDYFKGNYAKGASKIAKGTVTGIANPLSYLTENIGKVVEKLPFGKIIPKLLASPFNLASGGFNLIKGFFSKTKEIKELLNIRKELKTINDTLKGIKEKNNPKKTDFFSKIKGFFSKDKNSETEKSNNAIPIIGSVLGSVVDKVLDSSKSLIGVAGASLLAVPALKKVLIAGSSLITKPLATVGGALSKGVSKIGGVLGGVSKSVGSVIGKTGKLIKPLATVGGALSKGALRALPWVGGAFLAKDSYDSFMNGEYFDAGVSAGQAIAGIALGPLGSIGSFALGEALKYGNKKYNSPADKNLPLFENKKSSTNNGLNANVINNNLNDSKQSSAVLKNNVSNQNTYININKADNGDILPIFTSVF